MPTQQAVIYNVLGWSKALQESYPLALNAFESAVGCGLSSNTPIYQYGSHFMQTLVCLETDQTASMTHLSQGLALVRQLGVINFFQFSPSIVAKLCALALAHDIEKDFVKQIIEQRQLKPPALCNDTWHWGMRIYVLGGLRIELEGQSLLEIIRKQKKPFEVLRAIISFGKQGAVRAQLVRRIYPKQSYASARASFDVAFGRLRHLLNNENLFTVEEGRIAFNLDHVWVDAWYWSQLCQQIEAQLNLTVKASSETRHTLQLKYIELVNLYQEGAFIGDDNLPWLLQVRQNLSEQLIRVSQNVGKYLELSNAHDEAAIIYIKALQYHPAIEAFYQGLIRCELKQKHYAEALRIYRRCEDIIHSTYAVKVSPSTTSLVQQLL